MISINIIVNHMWRHLSKGEKNRNEINFRKSDTVFTALYLYPDLLKLA